MSREGKQTKAEKDIRIVLFGRASSKRVKSDRKSTRISWG